MELMEIILLVAGGIIFILSFFIPDRKPASGSSVESAKGLAAEEVKTLVSQEINSIREHVDDVVGEAVGYAVEKTERSLERLSNEKIMAVSEYSDTVLKEIHKNHEEAVFLYDMLNNKHTSLKNAVSEVNSAVKEAEETVLNIQKLAPEASAEGRIPEAYADSSAARGPEKPKKEMSGLERLGVAGPAAESAKAEPPEIKSAKAEPGKAEAWIPEKISPPEGAEGAKDAQAGRDAAGRGRNSNELILGLFRQGKSTVAIARELGLGVGEVRLVIDLFENR